MCKVHYCSIAMRRCARTKAILDRYLALGPPLVAPHAADWAGAVVRAALPNFLGCTAFHNAARTRSFFRGHNRSTEITFHRRRHTEKAAGRIGRPHCEKEAPHRGLKGTRVAPAARWCNQPGLPFQLLAWGLNPPEWQGKSYCRRSIRWPHHATNALFFSGVGGAARDRNRDRG